MNRYYFELIGLHIALETQIPLEMSQSLQPFMCQPYFEAADCTISVGICDALPQPEGIWHGPECYLREHDQLHIFHCHEPHGKPFAVTRIDGKNDIKITVLADFAGYFSGSSGIFNRIGFENLLLQHRGVLLHASLIDYAGHGIAFTGPSGVGKSTQAQLWQTHLGAEILNGDRAALRKTESGWTAYGSPYAGTSRIYKNKNVPLDAIVVLRQCNENRLRPMGLAEALTHIWSEISLRRWDASFVESAMELCAELLKDIPIYLLECLPEENAALALKKGLSL